MPAAWAGVVAVIEVALPTVTIVLFLAGAFIRARHHLGGRWARFLLSRTTPVGRPSRDGLDLLVLMAGLFPILLIALPTTPKFGGTKHWMPAMPFIALLAGVGAARLADVAASAARRLPGRLVRACVLSFRTHRGQIDALVEDLEAAKRAVTA